MPSPNADLIKDWVGKDTTNVVSPNADLINQFVKGNGIIAEAPPSEVKKNKELYLDEIAAKNRNSFIRGMRDIIDTGAHGLARTTSTVADAILPEKIASPIRESKNELLANDKKELNKYNLENPETDNLDIHRLVGQTVATAPLLPVKAFSTVTKALGALPTATKNAPLLNRLTASTVVGGTSGAEFGALTSSTNDKSTLKNAGEGLIIGALSGPVITGASTIAQKTLPTLKAMWANLNINKLAETSGLEPSAVKNIVTILENAGLSPREAQLRLNKMGPDATISDLAQSIQTETSGIASFGGKPTEILKSRFEARSKTANSSAHNLMEQKLGTKPNIEEEKENIIKKVQKEVKPDYEAAKKYNGLDIQNVVDDIDKELASGAVGEKAQALKLIKSYLYNKDINGNSFLKHNAKELHEVRMAIDSVLEGKNPKTSYGKYAKNALENVRGAIDEKLKSIPEMAAADAKFASKMQIVNDIDIGYNILKNGMNKEEFAKFYDALPLERQEAIQKGLRANIGDLMEKASRGELSEAQRLFGKSSINRANLEKVFGYKGTEVLDALEKEAIMRSTERGVVAGSQTAERQAIQRKYGERTDKPGVGQIIQGAVLDTVTGTPGGATAIMTAKRFGGDVKLKITEGKRERLVEGTADLLSRQGTERNLGLDVANKVSKINNKISKFKLPVVELPTYLLAPPIGESGYLTYKKLKNQ